MSTSHQVPQGTLAAALTQAGVVTSNYVQFCLLDFIDDALVASGELKARVFSSLAWMLDTMVVNKARAVFFDTYRESIGAEDTTMSIDKWNEFVSRMNEQQAVGEHIAEVGFENTSSYDELQTLLNMRKFWHDEAQRVATRQYQPKSLAELIASEKARATTPESKMKLKMRAQFAAPDDEALQARLLESLILKNDLTLAQQHELRQKINPAVMRIIEMATQSAMIKPSYDGEAPPFHELQVQTRISLVTSAISSIERGLSDMSNMRSVTLDDYAIAIREGTSLQKRLQEVLESPSFKVD